MLFNWNLKLSIGEYQTIKKVTVWLHKGLYQEHAVDWKDNYIMGVNIINTKRVAWENDLSHTADFLKAHSNKTKSMKTEWPQVLDLQKWITNYILTLYHSVLIQRSPMRWRTLNRSIPHIQSEMKGKLFQFYIWWMVTSQQR